MRWRRRSGRMGARRLARIAVAVAILAPVLSACGSSKKVSASPAKPAASQASTRPRRQDLADLVAKVRSGVVRIENGTCAEQAIGTGFLLSPRLVATVEHVADGATSIELKRSGEFIGSATVIGADAPRDLALVRTNTPIHGYAFHINGRAPRLGEEVVALGFPLGLPLSATRGVVSGSDRTVPIEGMKRRGLVQTTPRSTTATAAAP
jgi:S1-C subfamily serine protease